MPIQTIFRTLRAASPASLALLCAVAAHTGSAQTAVAADAASPANPAASVPPVSYRSVFKETSLGVEKDTVDWRKANSDVGRFMRGHLDILKEEEAEQAKPMLKPMGDAAPMPKPVAPDMPDKSMNAPKQIAVPKHQH